MKKTLLLTALIGFMSFSLAGAASQVTSVALPEGECGQEFSFSTIETGTQAINFSSTQVVSQAVTCTDMPEPCTPGATASCYDSTYGEWFFCRCQSDGGWECY